MESWVGVKNVVFCIGYNAPTLLKSTKRGVLLALTDRVALSKHVTNLTMVHSTKYDFHIITCQLPHQEDPPYPPHRDALRSSLILSTGNLHQLPFLIDRSELKKIVNRKLQVKKYI